MSSRSIFEKNILRKTEATKQEFKIPKWKSLDCVSTSISTERPQLFPQFAACLMAGWVILASGASLGYGTLALPSMENNNSLEVTESDTSWMASSMMLGALSGAILSGPCIALGRRSTIWFLAFPLTAAWTLIGFSRQLWILVTAHAILGVCLGLSGDATQIYVCEVAHASWRGALGCIPILMCNIGMLLSYIAGLWLKWDELALFGAALTLPALILPIALPESPIYLISKDRYEEAIKALQKLRGPMYDITLEYQECLRCESNTGYSLSKLREMCNRDMIVPLLLTSIVRVLSRFCGLRAVQLYTVSILSDSKIDIDVGIATLATGAIQLVATCLACFIVDRIPRKTLLIISQGTMALSLGVLGGYLYFHQDVRSDSFSWIPFISILLYILFNGLGLSPISGLIVAELSPQRHRSILSSITGCISWLSAFVVTKTFVYLIKTSLKLYGTLWMYGGICLCGVIFVIIFLPETRGLKQCDIENLF